MGVATGIAVAGLVIGAGAGVAGAVDANQKAKDAQGKQEELDAALKDQRASMQEITNPYAGITNQYANLGVATKAAKFQAKEADKALANTLDTLRSTGASAGGATALAQAALQSKQGIAASIEQQEVANQKARAQGAMEADRMHAEGEKFMFEKQDEREMMDLDRTAAQLDQERQNEAAANQAMWTAIGGIGSSAVSGSSNIASTIPAGVDGV
jgi:hypothetical protein